MRRTTRDYGLLLALIIATLSYFPINQATHRGHILAGGLDSHIPLVPVFALPYLLFLPIFWAVIIYAFVTGRNFVRLALSLIIIYVVSDGIYWLYPTQMPRPQTAHGFMSGLVTFVYSRDHPYCDLPSEHVASAAIMAVYFWSFGRRTRLIATVFAALVIVSTLLIKQHSIIGALAGVALARAAIAGLKPYASPVIK